MLLLATIACGGSSGTATSPSATSTKTATFSLGGQVIAYGAAIPGARVSIADGPNTGKSTTTDSSGNYTLTELQPSEVTVSVSATNYVSQSRRMTLTSNQTADFSLQRLPTTGTFHVTGIATDDDGAPATGATVTVSVNAPDPPHPRSTSTVTDARGSYSVDVDASYTGPNVAFALVNADSPGHDSFVDYLFPGSDSQNTRKIFISKNLHLYRITRITAGESIAVTVVPGDTVCGLSADDLVCRTVHIVIPTDGMLTASCPGLIVEVFDLVRGDTVKWPVKAGTEVEVNIGMWLQSTVSQACMLKTSLAPG